LEFLGLGKLEYFAETQKRLLFDQMGPWRPSAGLNPDTLGTGRSAWSVMDVDFSPYFEKYEALVATAEAAFERVKQAYADCVKCEQGCADCCHALFDLTFIEALYIQYKFSERFKGKHKVELLEKANRADRRIYKLKRQAFRDFQSGKNEGEILVAMAFERLRCPLLNAKDLCDLYEYRPITCRLYGIPTAIGSTGHTCGKSGFNQGEKYPTIHLDAVHSRLQQISAELLRDIKSKNIKLADLLIPLSSAILTTFDEAFLGLSDEPMEDVSQGGRSRRRK
jgi:Fe-S-cluster containining protein